MIEQSTIGVCSTTGIDFDSLSTHSADRLPGWPLASVMRYPLYSSVHVSGHEIRAGIFIIASRVVAWHSTHGTLWSCMVLRGWHEIGILHLLMKNVLELHSGGLGIVAREADRGSHLFHLCADMQFPRLFQCRRVQFPPCLGRWFGPT